MLGCSHEGTAQVAAEVGSPWSRYALEAATGLIIAHGTWLARSDGFGRFIHHGAGTAAIDWEAAIDALNAGGLPCSPGNMNIRGLGR